MAVSVATLFRLTQEIKTSNVRRETGFRLVPETRDLQSYLTSLSYILFFTISTILFFRNVKKVYTFI